ncbi:hypothetical protein X278_08105 [Oenococcus oeni IOEB_0205]|nr:hypothetical protein X278_08105 [Oenococcus oeni IOEB_0205]
MHIEYIKLQLAMEKQRKTNVLKMLMIKKKLQSISNQKDKNKGH